jgi:anti-sigma regulatory factor (Ser/Thr protein kinase)
VLPSSSGSDLDEPIDCTITESSQIADVRRRAVTLAQRFDFNETQCGQLALVITEAATNLLKHAQGGHLFLRALEVNSSVGIELLVSDKGPGMVNPERCLRDGFSTAGTPGTGLGAIQRLSHFFDMFAAPGAGCVVVSRSWKSQTQSANADRWRIGVVNIPMAGESICGDAWAVAQTDDQLILLVADGLGHGPIAAAAAREAVRAFRLHLQHDTATLVRRIHEVLKSTRGSAVAVAKISLPEREVRFTGLGNISAAVISNEQCRNMISHNGTAGGEARKIQEFVYPFPVGALMVLHSDGVATRWRLADYPGLARRDPSVIAGVLFEHFQRGRDDATVVVVSETATVAS